jgi:hypothetical protein
MPYSIDRDSDRYNLMSANLMYLSAIISNDIKTESAKLLTAAIDRPLSAESIEESSLLTSHCSLFAETVQGLLQ